MGSVRMLVPSLACLALACGGREAPADRAVLEALISRMDEARGATIAEAPWSDPSLRVWRVEEDSRFGLEDRPSGAAVTVTVEDACLATKLRARSNGIEDYALVAGTEELRYRIELSRVAGLRLVSDVLELVDGKGTPRLRASGSWILDSAGTLRRASLDLEGCAFDRDPRPPWGRPPAAPGDVSCTLVVRWNGQGLVEPVLVDPLWSTTRDMIMYRWRHAASLIDDRGRVLVAGGLETVVNPTASAEVFDPATGTWAATGDLVEPRLDLAAVQLAPGRVLVSGGDPPSDVTASIYEDGTFTKTGDHLSGRSGHTLHRLDDGTVAAIGGDAAGLVERYQPATGTWTAAGMLGHPRRYHAATVLSDGRVLVTGGNGGQGEIRASEIVDVSSGSVLQARDALAGRYLHGAALLPGERVMVVGGAQGDAVQLGLDSTEIYDVAADSWSWGPSLSALRFGPVVTLLPSGAWLVAGGSDAGQATESATHATAEILDEDSWVQTEGMQHARAMAQPVRLPDGRTLITGGLDHGTASLLQSAEIVGGRDLAEPCQHSGECRSGHCADGVCCDTACGGCQACTAVLKGTGVDGACGPVMDETDPHAACPDECGPRTCRAGSCAAAGPQADCGGYACIDGSCLDECNGVEECAPGYACNSERRCIPPPIAAGEGCGCRVARSPPLAGALALAWLAVIGARRRRR